MIKTILKEMMIVLLLCIAILFVLSILFYDYNPINKVVPNKIAYSAPENIRNELEENIQNTLSIDNKVYTVEGSDLNIYKRSKSYNPSKENPFVSTTSGEINETTNTTKTNITNTTQKTNTNTSANNNTETNQNAGNTSSKTNTRLK